MLKDVIRESPLYQLILSEGLERGLAQGLEQGIEQGIEQGERSLLVRLLEQRFGGPLAPELRRRIDAGSKGDIERWAERLFSVDRLDEVFAD